MPASQLKKRSKFSWAVRRRFAWTVVYIQCALAQWYAHRGSVVLGFDINRKERAVLNTIIPGARHVLIRHARQKRGWTQTDADKFLKKISKLLNHPNVTTVIWGKRDIRELNHDFLKTARKGYRLEVGLYAGRADPKGHHSSVIPCREGVYFDGSGTSTVEQTLNALQPGRGDQEDARILIDHILKTGLTKYDLQTTSQKLPADALLIVGQCTGDQAIEFTPTVTKTNPGLVGAVLENIARDGQPVFFKPHPYNPVIEQDADTIRQRFPKVIQLDPTSNITSLLAQRPVIATTTSGVGLEAAIRGCAVHTFGTAFYSNWGFTVDHLACPRRTNHLSAKDVFASVVIDQTRYLDPTSGEGISALDAFGLQIPAAP